MSLYVSIDLSIHLKKDTPESVMNFLRKAIDPTTTEADLDLLVDRCADLTHPYFSHIRRYSIFWGKTGLAYKPPALEKVQGEPLYTLHVYGGVNYGEMVVADFCRWISPWVDAEEGEVTGKWVSEIFKLPNVWEDIVFRDGVLQLMSEYKSTDSRWIHWSH